MKSAHKRKTISHFVGLNGIGGVQSNFIEYMKNIDLNHSRYNHKVYTIGNIDSSYKLSNSALDIRKTFNLCRLILDIVSKDVIVHFYNNLSSFKLAFFLFFLPVNKLIVHERGTIWNQKHTNWLAPCFVAWKASVIISNSLATKTMLIKKFSIPKAKIQVLHNGINTTPNFDCVNRNKKDARIFRIGFIGRLDSPKGVHTLIDAMSHIKKENFELIIAGEGVLGEYLRARAYKLNNVKFIGRIDNQYSFFGKIDLLVVPSIREPLGNVCLEAGLCKTPVLATNVDGIPEIIENGVNGELIEATEEVSIINIKDSVPLPEFVVDSATQQLKSPMQVSSFLLAKKILELSEKPEQMSYYAINLHKKVMKYFNITRYRSELHAIYTKLFLL